jgi:hypothetical protein
MEEGKIKRELRRLGLKKYISLRSFRKLKACTCHFHNYNSDILGLLISSFHIHQTSTERVLPTYQNDCSQQDCTSSSNDPGSCICYASKCRAQFLLGFHNLLSIPMNPVKEKIITDIHPTYPELILPPRLQRGVIYVQQQPDLLPRQHLGRRLLRW